MQQWKDIEGYEGYYQISNHGEVKSLYREVFNKKGNIQRYPEKLLNPEIYSMSNTKYKRVTLSKEGKTKRFLVHRLVAQHFIHNKDNKPFINHIDNNGLNNNYTNLEWCTHSENMIHAQKHGRLTKAQSSGGIKGSSTNKNKMLNRMNNLIGTRIKQWLIVSIDESKRRHMVIKCLLCNNYYIRRLDYIEHSLGNCCIHCSKTS